MCATATNEFFVWGRGTEGQLGLGFQKTQVHTATRAVVCCLAVPSLTYLAPCAPQLGATVYPYLHNTRIHSVAAGGNHSVVLAGTRGGRGMRRFRRHD